MTDNIPYKVTIARVYFVDLLLRKMPDVSKSADISLLLVLHGSAPAHKSRVGQVAVVDSDSTQQMRQCLLHQTQQALQ